MSIEVASDEVAEAIAGRTGQAYLVTLRSGGEGDGGVRPHVVAVRPEVRSDGAVVVRAGRRTTANVAAHPAVTLLWPTDEGDPTHSLLVDGAARSDGDDLVVSVTAAVLHRRRAAADSTRD